MSDTIKPAMADAGMACPDCKVDLVMSERRGVEIDYCPRCRGMWLDRGKLDLIVERSLAETARPGPQAEQRPASYDNYGGGHGSGHGGHGSGHGGHRRSLFGRLFD